MASGEFNCPNPRCNVVFTSHADVCIHLAEIGSPCTDWTMSVVQNLARERSNVSEEEGNVDEEEGYVDEEEGYGDKEEDDGDEDEYEVNEEEAGMDAEEDGMDAELSMALYADSKTDEEPPSLIPVSQGAHDDSNDPLPAPPAPLDINPPPVTSFAGLRKTYHPNMSVGLPGGHNLLQQIQAGNGPDDEFARARLQNIFYPFSSRRDWQLAKWLVDSSLTQSETDAFLKLDRVCIILQHILISEYSLYH